MPEKQSIELGFRIDSQQIARSSVDAKEAAAAADRLEKELRDLEAAYQRGSVQAQRYREEKQRITQALQSEAAAVRTATAGLSAGGGMQESWVRASEGAGRYLAMQQKVTSGAGSLNYRLMAMAGLMDDLQYVGEMGLRPIMNQLSMISPQLAIVTIAGNMIYKSWDQIAPLVKSTFAYWTDGANSAREATYGLAGDVQRLFDQLVAGGKGIGSFFGAYGEGLDAISGGRSRRDKAAINDFSERHSAGDLAQGDAVKKGLSQFSGKEVLDALIKHEERLSPNVRQGGDLREREMARLAALVKAAESGDSNAVASVRQKLAGTKFGEAIDSADPIKQKQLQEWAAKAREREQRELQAQEETNERIDAKRKAAAAEVADAMKARVAAAIANAAAEGADQADLARMTRTEIAAHLRATGQVTSKEDASAIAALAYEQIFRETWSRIRARVNAGRGDQKQAASAVAQQLIDEDPLQKRVIENARRTEAANKARDVASEEGLQSRIAAGTGMVNPLAQMMINAREQGIGYQLAKSSTNRRAWSRMTWEERERYISRGNDRVDQRLTADTSRYLLRSGYTRSKEQADMIAQRMVAEARGVANGRTGDPQTAATKDLTDTLKTAVEVWTEINKNGVRQRLVR
jgi:hypothetical protein